jgi:hypothetical protein
MPREAAQLVLVGISFVTGLMGSYAAESAANIVGELRGAPAVLAAVCTFASAATAPVGIRILAAALPVAFVAPVFWRQWRQVRERGILLMFGLFLLPYLVLGIALALLPCRAS